MIVLSPLGISQTCVNSALVTTTGLDLNFSSWDSSIHWSLAHAPSAGEVALFSKDTSISLPSDSSVEVYELRFEIDSTLYFKFESEIVLFVEPVQLVSPKFTFVNASAFSFEVSSCPVPASCLSLRGSRASTPSTIEFEAQVTVGVNLMTTPIFSDVYIVELLSCSGISSPHVLYTESVYLSPRAVCLLSDTSCKIN